MRPWRSKPDPDTAPPAADQSLRMALADAQADIAALREAVTALAERAERAERLASQAQSAMRLNEEARQVFDRLADKLDADKIGAHLAAAIARTPVVEDPFPHMVVEDLLPEPFYQLLCRTIPPAVFFGDRDPIKQNLRMPVEFAPELTLRVWRFFDQEIAAGLVRPLVSERLAPWIRAQVVSLFGEALADDVLALPQGSHGGRLMLRRPGYRLAPHRDPKRVFVTCLFYLPGKRDLPFGTQLHAVEGDGEAPYAKTYYPEEAGGRCRLVRDVPCRHNSALFMVNGAGAHGASIPADATPPTLERHSYQFYVGPTSGLEALVARLPEDRRARWA